MTLSKKEIVPKDLAPLLACFKVSKKKRKRERKKLIV